MMNKLELLENTETLSIKWIFQHSETTTTITLFLIPLNIALKTVLVIYY